MAADITDSKLLEEAKELVAEDLMEDAVTEHEISSQMVQFLMNRKLKFLLDRDQEGHASPGSGLVDLSPG